MKKLFLIGLAIAMSLLLVVPVLAAEEAVTEEEKEEFKANFVIPRVDEIFTAMDSLGEVNWEDQVNRINTADRGKFDYQTEEVLALNLGIRVSDAVVAIKVKDKEAVGKFISTAEKIADKLNVSAVILEKAQVIKEAIKKDNWDEVLTQISALENDVITDLVLRDNSDLSVLVTLAGWLEGLNIVSGSLSEEYSAPTATILRQPGLISFYLSQLVGMKEETKGMNTVKGITNLVKQLQVLCEVPQGKAVAKENIDKISSLVSDVINDIITHE